LSGDDENIVQFAKDHNIVMAKRSTANGKTTVYVLSKDEMNSKDKSEFEKEFMQCFDPQKYNILFIRDLHPSQLKKVIEDYKTVYVGDKELCDAILAAILTLGHDFRHFVNKKMSMLIKKKLSEILPSFTK